MSIHSTLFKPVTEEDLNLQDINPTMHFALDVYLFKFILSITWYMGNRSRQYPARSSNLTHSDHLHTHTHTHTHARTYTHTHTHKNSTWQYEHTHTLLTTCTSMQEVDVLIKQLTINYISQSLQRGKPNINILTWSVRCILTSQKCILKIILAHMLKMEFKIWIL